MEHLDPPSSQIKVGKILDYFGGDEGFLQAGDFHRSLGPPWDKS